MAPHSSTPAWKIPRAEEPGGLQSMGSRRVGHDWATSLPLLTFMHWRRKWQPTPLFLPGESRDGGAWWAAVYGVAQSRTRPKRLSSSSINTRTQSSLGIILHTWENWEEAEPSYQEISQPCSPVHRKKSEYANIYVYICVHVCICTHIYCMCVSMHMCMHIRLYACVWVIYTYSCIHTCVLIYSHVSVWVQFFNRTYFEETAN